MEFQDPTEVAVETPQPNPPDPKPSDDAEVLDRIEHGTHFRIRGHGPVVVLIHGVGLDLTLWERQISALQRQHCVIAYDLLGHGESASLPVSSNLRSFVQQLERLRGDLEIDRMTLVGFSLGALVAQAYALAHPERLVGLGLLSGVYARTPEQIGAVRSRHAIGEKEGPAALIEVALERWFSDAFRDDHPDEIEAVRERLARNDPKCFLEAYRIFCDADPELAGRLGEIGCPSLVLTGALDPGSTPAMTEAMGRDLPDARVRILPDLRHMAPVEGAAAVNTALLEFLREIG
jgi:pimeloyl-ACP methyl ester carboxylesterase